MKQRVMDSSTAEQMWLLTSRMAAEAKEQGMDVSQIFALLRNAKSILNEARLDKHVHRELVTRAENLINEAQQEVFIAAAPLGKGFEEKWEALVKKALMGERIGEFPFSGIRYYPSIPKEGGWVRLALKDKLPMAKVKELARAHSLGYKADEEGHAVLTGDRDSLRKALRVISKYYSGA
ncbi:MAG: DUF2096 family protein [Candidatus Hydrothermarchaeota archaeon]|nr:DUF2096 family protein [Candidatus Hydrothermarchaeota archaeon]